MLTEAEASESDKLREGGEAWEPREAFLIRFSWIDGE